MAEFDAVTSSVDVVAENNQLTSESLNTETTIEGVIEEAQITAEITETHITGEVVQDVITELQQEVTLIGEIYYGWRGDNGVGVPTGGAVGEFLKKTGIDDFATGWAAITISDITGLSTALAWKEATITAGTTAQYWRGDKTWQTLDKTAVGLGNVDNTSDLAKPISTLTQTALDDKADLVAGKVPASQLPAYVDDVVEAANYAALILIAGETGKIYVTLDDGKTYRWSGSAYVEISASLALGETSSTAYRGDRGKIAYDHSQTTGNPHGTTINDITGLQTALDGKVPTSRTITINGVTYDLSDNRSWTVTSGGTPSGSTGYIQYNTGGAFDAKSTFVFAEDLDALGLQVAVPKAAAHFASITGATIADVTVSSASLSNSTSISNPTGSGSLIAEPTQWSGGSGSLSDTGMDNNFYADGKVYTARVYPCLYNSYTGAIYKSQFYEEITFTDPTDYNYYNYLNFNWGSVSIFDETVYYFVEIDVNSGGYQPIGTFSGTSLQITSIGGSDSTTPWPSEYTNAGGTAPSVPSGLNGYYGWYGGSFQDTSTSTFSATGRQWQIEVDAYNTISGTIYVSGTPTTGGFTDDSMSMYRVASAWSSGGSQEGFIYRRRYSDDGGSSWSDWSYTSANDFDGTYFYKYDEDYSNDTGLEARWGQTYSPAAITKSFDVYGIGTSPSGNTYYSAGYNTYSVNIPADSVRYIIKHTFSGIPAGGAKILAPSGGVSYGYVTSNNFYDLWYTSWGYGTTVTPTTYGFTGTNQNREYFFYGYSTTLGIYSVNADISSTTLISGEKYVTGSFTYPSGVTRVRVFRRVNGTGSYYYKDFTSPTNTFTDDALDNSWTFTGTYPPTNTAVTPGTLRLDRQITSLSNVQFQLAVVGTGTGTRYAGIAFGVATDSTTDASFQSYIYHESNTGYLHASTGAFRVVSSIGGTYVAQLWASGTILNNLASSSNHLQVKGLNNQYNIMQRSDSDTVCFGAQYSSDPGSAVFIQPWTWADLAIVLSGHSSHSTTSPILRVQTSAWSYNASITTGGYFLSNIGTVSNPGQAFHTDTDTGLYGPSANILGAVTGGVERARWSSAGYDVKAGGSSSNARVGGCLTQFYTDAGNTTTSETDIYSYSVPASTLDTNGHKIRAEYAGTCVNSTSTKQIKVKFDGTTILDTGALAVSASAHWAITVLGVRVSATVIRFTVKFIGTGLALTQQTTYTSVTVANFTSARILKLTGTAAGAGAATNDIVARNGIVEFIPNI